MRSWNVRRFVAALTMAWALMTAVAVADEQQAAAPAPAPAPVDTAPVAAPTVPAAPVRHVHRVSRRPAPQSFFQRVMELERRKNAWLMRTFLGR